MKLDKTIWILEDDSGSRFIYSDILEVRYNLRFFGSLKEFKDAGLPHQVDLMIVDLKLPDGNFINHLRELPKGTKLSCDFMVVSAMDDLDVLRACFEDGAADFLSKPFTKNSLIVKVEQLIARKNKRGASPFHLFGVDLDPIASTLSKVNLPSVTLTSKEFQIISCLAKAGNQGVTREQLQTQVWNDVTVNGKTLDVHLANLRKKIGTLALDLQCHSKAGYILTDRVGKQIGP